MCENGGPGWTGSLGSPNHSIHSINPQPTRFNNVMWRSITPGAWPFVPINMLRGRRDGTHLHRANMQMLRRGQAKYESKIHVAMLLGRLPMYDTRCHRLQSRPGVDDPMNPSPKLRLLT